MDDNALDRWLQSQLGAQDLIEIFSLIKINDLIQDRMLFEIKLGILVKSNDDPVLREAIFMGIRKALEDDRKVESIKIRLGTWNEGEFDHPLGFQDKTKVIIEAVF